MDFFFFKILDLIILDLDFFQGNLVEFEKQVFFCVVVLWFFYFLLFFVVWFVGVVMLLVLVMQVFAFEFVIYVKSSQYIFFLDMEFFKELYDLI